MDIHKVKIKAVSYVLNTVLQKNDGTGKVLFSCLLSPLRR
jgi:hypothetical protein